jgi:hypothetical protein
MPEKNGVEGQSYERERVMGQRQNFKVVFVSKHVTASNTSMLDQKMKSEKKLDNEEKRKT